MPESKPTHEERPSERREEPFVGREQECEAFLHSLRNEEPEHHWFAISGEPGTGKTFLLERLRSIALEQGALTALANEAEKTADREQSIVRAMARLAEQLSEAGAPLSGFTERYERYRVCMQTTQSDPAAPLGAFDHLGGMPSWLAVGAPRITHSGRVIDGAIRDIMSRSDTAVERRAARSAYVEAKFESPDDRAVIEQPVETLTPLFVRDLNRHGRRARIVLCFDGWELTAAHLYDWLRQIIKAGGLNRGIWVVLAGTLAPSGRWEAFSSRIERFDLRSFTRRESRIYLAWTGISDRPAQEQIIALSGGLPVLMSTMSGGDQRRSLSLGGGPVEHHLASLESARLRGVIVGCSAARRLDDELLHEAAGGDQSAPEVRDWLTRLPFLERRPGYWSYHPEIRRLMLRFARRRSVDDSRTVHVRLAAYHRDQLDDKGESFRTFDGTARQHLLEALYHSLMAEQPAGVTHGIETFLLALRDDLRFADEVLATWSQAALEQESDNEVTHWAEQTSAALLAARQQDWEVVSRACSLARTREGLSAEARSVVALAAALAQHGMANYEEAIEEYDRAIDLGIRAPRAAAACHFNRGKARYATGRYTAAGNDMSAAIKLSAGFPGVSGLHGSRGDVRVRVSAFDQAIDDYDQALAVQLSADAEAVLRNNRATARLASEQFKAALADYDRALEFELSPAEAGAALAGRALAHMRSGDTERAISDCDCALDLEVGRDTAAEILTIRALANVEEGELERAVQDLGRAIEASPEGETASAALNNLGYTRWHLGELAQAIDDYSRAIWLAPSDSIAPFSRGLIHYATGTYHLAIDDLTAAIELGPDEPAALLHRGNAYLDFGDYHAAILDYSRFLTLGPEGPAAAQALYNRASARYAMGKLDEAITDYGEALEQKPEAAHVYHGRGFVLCELGKYADALADLNQAVELGLLEAALFYNRGRARAHEHDYWGAVADYDHALELNADAPTAAQIHLSRGMVYEELQDYAQAVKDYDRAIDLDHDTEPSCLAFQRRASAHHSLGTHELAIEDSNRALELCSMEARAAAIYLLRADSYLQLAMPEEAVADYERAIDILPDTKTAAIAFLGRGSANLELGDHGQAAKDLDWALELGLEPQATVEALKIRGVALASQGNHERAIHDYERAIELEAERQRAAPIYLNRGSSFLALGEYVEAIGDFDRALALGSADQPSCYINRGNAYAQLGQRRRANADYDAAMHLSPADAAVYFNRARVHCELMEYEQAVAWYTKALELCGDGPIEAEIHSGRGSAYAGLGAFQPAIEDYGLALELKPETKAASVICTNRGLAYDRIHEHERAIEDYERAIELDPGNAAAYFSAACAYSLLWNPADAWRTLERAIELDEIFREKAATEVDLGGIRDSERFRALIGTQG